MSRSRIVGFAAPAVSLALAALAWAAPPPGHTTSTKEPKHWSYDGASGPEHWGDLDKSFETCRLGHLQSPIDIPAATIEPRRLDPIGFDYKAVPLRLMDNGHTIMVSYPAGSTIRIGGARYELQQFHLHRPSEETIDGKSFPMGAHLVHRSKDGKLAVVTVLFDEGAPNPALASVLEHVPAEPKQEGVPAGVTLDASALLPGVRSYFTFQGSLTTPPCSEGVTWYVLRSPVTASADQIAAFAKRYPHNARPVQPLGAREIRSSE